MLDISEVRQRRYLQDFYILRFTQEVEPLLQDMCDWLVSDIQRLFQLLFYN